MTGIQAQAGQRGAGLSTAVVVAPEVAARIIERRTAGDLVADISHDLHLTPLEVSAVVRQARDATGVCPGCPAASCRRCLPVGSAEPVLRATGRIGGGSW